MDLDKTGKFIAECRKNQNLTQKQLADKLGINDKTISKWERGVNAPDISLLILLAKNLNVDVEEILKGKKKYKIEKKHSGLIIIVSIFILIIIILSSFYYDKYINLKKVDLYSLESTNKDYEVNGFIAMNNDNYVFSISKIDYINKSGGKIKELKLKEIEIKFFNGDDNLYSIKKSKDNNNHDLNFSNFVKTINFTVEEEKEKIDFNNLNLKIVIHCKEMSGEYDFISINLALKKYKVAEMVTKFST